MKNQNTPPRTDDFRIERDGGSLVLIFAPDGRTFRFEVDGDSLSEPQVSPPRARVADYVDEDVRRAAVELARLALKGAPPSAGG